MGGFRVRSMPFAWNPAYPARVGVMPREGTNNDVRWFNIEPCYVFHPVNAYTEDHDGAEVLVLDVVRHERIFDRDRRGPGEGRPTLDRWTINLTTGAVTAERRDDRSQEFPRINETLTGAKHRFGYTVGIIGGSNSAAPGSYKARCTSTTTRRETPPSRVWTRSCRSARCPSCPTPTRAARRTASCPATAITAASTRVSC